MQSHGNRAVLQERLHYDGSRTRGESLVAVRHVSEGLLIELSKELTPEKELVIDFLDFYK